MGNIDTLYMHSCIITKKKTNFFGRVGLKKDPQS